MDVPVCNVCHVALDEEEHQPRHLGCSHDACLTCIKALIKEGKLECPMCRTVLKAFSPDDFQINHGAVQILRLFKGLKIQIGEKNSTEEEVANIRKICRIHEQVANGRCLTCTIWICIKCKDIHTKDIGCEILEYDAFLVQAKKDHKDKVEPAIQTLRNNLKTLSTEISDLESKRKAIDEQIEKLKICKDEGTRTLNKFIAASSNVDKVSTSMELDKFVHESDEWYKFSKIWCKKNTKTSSNLLEEIKAAQETYTTLDINGKSSSSKLTFEDGNMYLHCFRSSGSTTTTKASKIIPYEQVQKWLPAIHDHVFLDLAINGSVQGRVTIRIRQDLPSYANNIPLLFTGERGKGSSLLGLSMIECNPLVLAFDVSSVTKAMNPKITQNSKAGYNVVPGSVLAQWSGNNLYYWLIYHEDKRSQRYGSNFELFGIVESGLDIVKLCKSHSDQSQVTVTDCGITFKEDLLAKNLLLDK